MPDIRPFRGVRFDSAQQSNLGRVIAPPYDTVSDPLDEHSVSIAALENVDLGAGAASHALAAARYRAWRDCGTLRPDAAPALYVHTHAFTTASGERRQRRGLLARVRLADWGERLILPHERVFPGPRDERQARLAAVGANLSPLYLLYNDADGAVRFQLDAATAALAPVATGIDARGGSHQVQAITEATTLAAVRDQLRPEQLFVADGHHRYEAALRHRDLLLAVGPLAPDHPARFVLALLAPLDDPGVIVRPTHRVVRGPLPRPVDELVAWLSDFFALGDEREPNEAIATVILPARPPIQLYPKAGRPDRQLLPADRSDAWRQLPVAIGDHVILEHGLGIVGDAIQSQVWYTPDGAAAAAAVTSGEAALAIVYAPPALAPLVAVAAAGDLLPPKSTYFDPKPPAGLVISDLSMP